MWRAGLSLRGCIRSGCPGVGLSDVIRIDNLPGRILACDVEGVEPLSMVMKLVKMHGQPVVKFSDDPIKNV